MALIVEDGTIVANANSIVSEAEFLAYVADRGVDLVGDPSVLLILANDSAWIYNFNGELVDVAQTTPFPRKNLYVYDVLVADDVIPAQAKKGVMELAIAIDQGANLLMTQTQNIASASAGPLSVTFSTGSSSTPRIVSANTAFKPLLKGNNNGSMYFNVRPQPIGV